MEIIDTDKKKKIFRFKFSSDIVDRMTCFSKENKNLSKNNFTDNWDRWLESNRDAIDSEKKRLQDLGCEGNIENRLFRSARYYLCKKKEEKTESKKRRKYVSLDREFIDCIDNHIQNKYHDGISPKLAYQDFCDKNMLDIEQEIDRMFEDDAFDKEEGKKKIKKTYKNRVYQFTNK